MKSITEKEFQSEVVEQQGIVIVDFTADWCGPCHFMDPVLEDIEEHTDIKVVKVDVDKNIDIVSQFNIRSIPDIVFYKDGEVVSRKLGLTRKKEIYNELKKLNPSDINNKGNHSIQTRV